MKSSTWLFLGVIGLLLLLTVVLGVKACLQYQKKVTQAEEGAALSIPVHVTKVGMGKIEDVVYVTGYVEPSDRVDVIAKIPMPGKLIEAKAKKGDFVRKDQVLVTVDRDEVGAVYLAYGVKAPISGVVAEITDDRGSLVTPQRPVAVLIDIDRVKVRTSLIEADLGRVKEGTPARIQVDAHPERTFTGKVSRIEPVLDSFSHTAPVEISIQNSDHSLLPGMFARVELAADERAGVPILPRDAVFKRQGKDYAYLLNQEESRIFLTELKLGYSDLDRYEVIEGVKEGDLVVDKNLVILKDRTLVSISNPADVVEPPPSEDK